MKMRTNSLLKELNEIQINYNRIGLEDPFFGTVGSSNKDLEQYFEYGRQQVTGILSNAQKLGINLTSGTALDFGCGIGRVTQALAKQFDDVYGLDISPSMIALANDHNANPAKCHFRLHCDHQLRIFADDFFDLILGINVFRYISPALSEAYLREFIRILKPGGLLYFETSEAAGFRRIFPDSLLRIYRKFRHWQNSARRLQDRYHFPQHKVEAIISEAGAQVLRIDATPAPTLWKHISFFVSTFHAAPETSRPLGEQI
jgi:ubiquinone/menaquinone biosynthesis C-methylase UbiE